MATRKETAKRKVSLVQQIRREYQKGELAPGEMLPPVRVLARKYGISKRLVNEELQKLAGEGWVVTIPRKGIFIAEDAQASRRFLDHAVILLSATENPETQHRQSAWLDHVAYGALKEIHARGLHSIMLHPDRVCHEVLERLASEQPYGVIIPEMDGTVMKQYGDVLQKSGVRVVMNGDHESIATFDRVASDHEAGAYQLTQWLLQQGRKDIRLAWSVQNNVYWSAPRRKGFERALKEAGKRPPPRLDLSLGAALSNEEGVKFLIQKLRPLVQDKSVALDGLLVTSDANVGAFEEALRVLGKKPHRDVSICGYDNYWQDLEACGFGSARPDATIDKQNEEQGAQMVSLLLERAAGAACSSTRAIKRVVAPRLIVTEAQK